MIKFLLLLILIFSRISNPQTISALQKKIDILLTDRFFESTLIAVDIFDLQTGEILYQKNNKLLLHPASNMKILTSAAGLIFLNPDYEFQTSLLYTGEIVNGTLYGDLYIEGGCDPDFTSHDLDSLVEKIYSAGIKKISGKIYGDISMTDSLFWGEGWMWDDDPSTDAPYLTSLNINYNSIGISVEGDSIGQKALIYLNPPTGYVELINKTETVSSLIPGNLYITRDWINRKNTFLIEGKVNYEKSSLTNKDFKYFNLFKPENYFMTLFMESLQRKGIEFSYEINFNTYPSNANHLFTHTRSLDTVIYNVNKISDNLSAEMVLFALAEKYFNKPAGAKKGLKLIDSLITLSGFEPKNYRLVDGSGLSHYNLVSAELLLNILKYIYYNHPVYFNILYNSFPIAGVEGTLRKRMIGTAAQNNLRAKTGTLSGVNALSGYVTARNGNLIAFSLLIQNHVRNNSLSIYFLNEIGRYLAEYY